jgi:hypothetical protein
MNVRKPFITRIGTDSVVQSMKAEVVYLQGNGSRYPRVVIQLIPGAQDAYVFSRSAPYQQQFLFQVKICATADCVTGKSGPDVVDEIRESLLATLNDSSLTVTGGALAYIRHVRVIPDYSEKTAAGLVFMGGSIYRIEVNPT